MLGPHATALPDDVTTVRLLRRDDAPDALLEAIASSRSDARFEDGRVRWTERGDLTETIDIEARSTDGQIELEAHYTLDAPFFMWVVGPLVKADVKGRMRHALRTAAAERAGTALPSPRRRAVWAPPEPMTRAQTRTLAILAFVLAITGYGGSLLTQTIDFVAHAFDASNAQLGLVTALTRVGTLAALIGSALADRRGRRLVILWATVVGVSATFLTAFAPNLFVFATLQVIVRGAVNLASVVAFIAVTEEAPEGSRAYTLAVTGVMGSVGFILGAVLLPVGDLAVWGWRVLFGLGGLWLVFMPAVRTKLVETVRYTDLAARNAPRGRPGELVDRLYGGRFVVLALTGFLLNVFFAPTSQFTNRYLQDERGFSGFGVLLLRAVTQGLPALVAVWIGGRVAESAGRKPAARWGLLLTAAASAAFFLTGGPVLWIMLTVSTAAIAFAGPSLSAFNTEMFPTEVRGTAGAALLGSAVAGSVVGLLVTGAIAEPLGTVGRAVALTSIAPVIVALVLIRRLPEARGRDLDDVSPPEV